MLHFLYQDNGECDSFTELYGPQTVSTYPYDGNWYKTNGTYTITGCNLVAIITYGWGGLQMVIIQEELIHNIERFRRHIQLRNH